MNTPFLAHDNDYVFTRKKKKMLPKSGVLRKNFLERIGSLLLKIPEVK